MRNITKTLVIISILFLLLSANSASAKEVINSTKDSPFTIEEGVLTSYNGEDEVLVIPEGVTKINDFVFQNNTIIKRVEFPNSLLYIGSSAFFNCTNLEEVIMRDSVTHIDAGAFDFCECLINVTISEGLQWIDSSAFSNTPWLAKMQLKKPCLSLTMY